MSEGVFHVVCMGTSLTDSWSAHNWPILTGDLVQIGKKQRVKFTAHARQGQVSRWGFENIGRTVGLRPDVVLIEFCTNDSSIYPGADPYDIITLEEAYDWTIGMIQAIRVGRSDTKIFLMTMSVPNSNNGQDQYRGALPQYYDQYRRIASEEGVGLIDNHPDWVARGPAQSLLDQPDGSHPELFALKEVLIPNVVRVISPLVN